MKLIILFVRDCLGVPRSALVLRVTNESERPATDVFVELLLESRAIRVVGGRERTIPLLVPQGSQLFAFTVERTQVAGAETADITLAISVRASAEGFPNVDLGITKRRLPIARLSDAVQMPAIPKLFQIGEALRPAEPDLFQGRSDVLTKVQASFYGGIQRERYFLDGIRRVGKTSIINFVPLYLPATILPVDVNFDNVGLQGPINSGRVLAHLCTRIADTAALRGIASVPQPDETIFAADPARAFTAFRRCSRLHFQTRYRYL